MSWVNRNRAAYRMAWSLSVISLAAVCLWFGADLNTAGAQEKNREIKTARSNFGGTTFPGTGGAIPDNTCGTTDLEVDFAVTGFPDAPGTVEVDMTFSPGHTWVGDLDMELVSPDGTRHWIQSYTGGQGTDAGDSSNTAGPYTFSDSAPSTPTWWGAAAAGDTDFVIPAGSYRTQAPGPDATDDPGPAITDMSAAFAGIPTSNGTWKLVIGDCALGDTGSISVANLTLTAAAAPGPAWLDMDGDGTSDYVQARATNTPFADRGTPFMKAGSFRERIQMQKDNPSIDNLGSTSIFWYSTYSSGGTAVQDHGIAATDFITPNDFDGDGKTDIAVWRTGPSGTAAFYLHRSSDSTVAIETFGQSGDDSGVTGDYDGDGTDDIAVFRCPSVAGQCTFFYRGSAGGGETTYVPWGFGTPFSQFANPGDFDGDGKHDFNIQRENPAQAGAGQFVLLRSSDFGVEYTNYGTNTDLIAPGDYDGDGMADYTVVRNSGGQFTWYSLLSGGGSQQVDWGITNDFLTPGDYDGDGKTDLAIWRPSSGLFYTYRSSDGAVETFSWGASADYPPANSQVH